MARPTIVEIDFDALKHNLRAVRERAPKSKVIAMIKANAYGHGLIRVAKTLREADALGVACIDEAVRIRQAGVTTPIIVMAGFFTPDELISLGQLNCSIVLHHQAQVEVLRKTHLSRPLKIWIKIDTGMHRLGFLPDQVEEVYQQLRQYALAQSPIGLMTHLSDADNATNEKTSRQIALFEQVTNHLNGERSLANSSCILNFPKSHADWVRPGLMLYGVSPVSGKTASDFGLKPVMTLRSKIMAVRNQRQGDEIGYSSAFICPSDMPVGIIAIGYGDGYPFHLGNGTPVLINSRVCSVIGRVAMDMMAVDLRSYPEAQVGDDVILWGEELPVERIAEVTHSIPYELLCGIARRVHGAE